MQSSYEGQVRPKLKMRLNYKTLVYNAEAAYIISLILFAFLSVNSASANISFFTAEGFVSAEVRHPSDTNYFFKTDGTFLFLYSNGIWQIQFTYQHSYHPDSIPSRKKMGTVIDCKRIPDGIREIITPPDNTNNPSATTSSSSFPSMAQQELFLPWLSLCPNPELPMVSSNLIHFDFRREMLSNPKNEGRFSIGYIEPGKQFLSELTVTNNGAMIQYDGNVVELPAPYNNGYIQFSYRVLAVTNYNGVTFPLNVVLYQFAPSPTGNSSDDIYPAVVSTLNVSRIATNEEGWDRLQVPSHLIALAGF